MSSAGSGARMSPSPRQSKSSPTFHEFASEWFAAKRPELRERTADDYQWALSSHLLPHFARFRLSEITVEEVDRYKRAKARQGTLSPGVINKTLTRLAQILEDAVEYGLPGTQSGKGSRGRRLKVDRARPIYIDTAAQIAVLLEAADELDRRSTARTSGRRPLVAALVFAGLRVTEACELRAGGTLISARGGSPFVGRRPLPGSDRSTSSRRCVTS